MTNGEVILRFLAGGICGSDVANCKAFVPARSEPGSVGRFLHEIVGEVVASQSDLDVGMRVVGWVSDSRGLSEYVTTSAAEVVVVSDQLDNVHAVPLQPLACVLHALSRLPNIPGARAAVIGLGPIGLLFAHALKDAGAASVRGVDIVDRQTWASTYRLDEVTHGSSQSWATAAECHDSFDLVVEAVGHQVTTVNDAISIAAPSGHVLCFGNPGDAYYPVWFKALMDKNLTLHAGRTPLTFRRDALRRAQSYLIRYSELLDAYVTQVYPIHDVQTAYEMASRPAPNQIKIVLES